MLPVNNINNNIFEDAKASLSSSAEPNVDAAVYVDAHTHEENAPTDGIDFEAIRQYWNKRIKESFSAMKSLKLMTDTRRSHIRARLKECRGDTASIYKAIDKAAASSFLNGGGSRGFIADFDWIMRPRNFPKILEGSFDDKTETTKDKTNAYETKYNDRQGWAAREFTEDEWNRLNQRPQGYGNS